MMKDSRKNIKPIEFDKKEVTILILEQFENILDKNNITIPDNDREGEESEARIYGETYYQLEDTINGILSEYVENRVINTMSHNIKILFEELKNANENIKFIQDKLGKRN